MDVLQQIATPAGILLTTMAVAWVLANPTITSPTVGASKPEQLEATIAALDVKLDSEVLAELDKATLRFR